MSWQPIETAPKDGSDILFWSQRGGYFAGNWPPECRPGSWEKARGRWTGSSDRKAEIATHWQPLPPPPDADPFWSQPGWQPKPPDAL